MLFKRLHITQNQRGLLLRDGEVRAVLSPGTYRIRRNLPFLPWQTVQIFELSRPKFQHRDEDALLKSPVLAKHLRVLELAEDQRAIVWLDGRLIDLIGAGRHAYWESAGDLRVEVLSVTDVRLVHPKLQAIASHVKATLYLNVLRIEPAETALVFRDGRFVEQIESGLHVYWTGNGKITHRTVDRREQSLDVTGQEVISADKVTIRLNATITYEVADAVKALASTASYTQSLYREVQLAIREAVGTRTVDDLLGSKQELSGELFEAVASKGDAIGVIVKSVGVRDLILPGDMRELFNGVIAAQKRAEANLIERREETAAARSQANTARLLADNPALQRLRELEAIKDILAGTSVTFVMGDSGNRSLVEQMKSLVQEPR